MAIGRAGRFGHQLGFYFSSFDVPKGGELFVWNASREAFLGSFTYANENLGAVWPSGSSTEAALSLNTATSRLGGDTHLGRQSSRSRLPLPAQTSGRSRCKNECSRSFRQQRKLQHQCQLSEGADWQIEKTAVALIVNGGFTNCSRSMVNNTANERPFLTANHCLGNPNTWTYYFNHESSTCSAAQGPLPRAFLEETCWSPMAERM